MLRCKYLLSNCEAKRDIVMESSGIWLVQREERFGLQCLNLTNFANGNLISAGYYFVDFTCDYQSVGQMDDFDFPEIRETLHCCKTNNYKFTTMFHLQIKQFMHELAVGILHAPLNLIFIAWISLEVIRITSYENKRAIEVGKQGSLFDHQLKLYLKYSDFKTRHIRD